MEDGMTLEGRMHWVTGAAISVAAHAGGLLLLAMIYGGGPKEPPPESQPEEAAAPVREEVKGEAPKAKDDAAVGGEKKPDAVKKDETPAKKQKSAFGILDEGVPAEHKAKGKSDAKIESEVKVKPEVKVKTEAEADVKAKSEPKVATETYVVKRGDTLTSIAKARGCTIADLAKINGVKLKKLSNVWVGQHIKVPKAD